jgi:hypothetical protein
MEDSMSIHWHVPSIKPPYNFQFISVMTSLHQKTSDVDLVPGFLHQAKLGSVAENSKLYDASIFMVGVW